MFSASETAFFRFSVTSLLSKSEVKAFIEAYALKYQADYMHHSIGYG